MIHTLTGPNSHNPLCLPVPHHVAVALCLLKLCCCDPDGRVCGHSLARLVQDLGGGGEGHRGVCVCEGGVCGRCVREVWQRCEGGVCEGGVRGRREGGWAGKQVGGVTQHASTTTWTTNTATHRWQEQDHPVEPEHAHPQSHPQSHPHQQSHP